MADASVQWYTKNFEQISKADALIGAQLADSKQFCEHTSASLCDEVFTVMQRGLSGSENSSILLLGEAGSGKTHVVEWCVRKLRDVQRNLTVLRAHGGAYATDVECVRHLASQATGQVVAAPKANNSFEQCLEWIRSVLAEGFRQASAVLIILERFEHFCSRARQTLLYNLFDIAQEVGVRLCIVGTSEKLDVMDALEKRIRSRFSMRHLHTFLPTSLDELISVLLAKLRLPADCGLQGAFRLQLQRKLEAALWAKAPQWRAPLELGRPVAWFLGQCMPVSALLRQACTGEASLESPPPAKRPRTAPPDVEASAISGIRAPLLSGLAEVEHLIMLALLRRQRRSPAAATLGAALHELQRLHEGGGLVAAFSSDQYCAAFDRLLQARLVELRSGGGADAGKLYAPCRSLVGHLYVQLAQDLQKTDAPAHRNPLRSLPQAVQQWVLRHLNEQ